MKKISIDHLPLSDNPNYSNDYISLFIYSAIMDPLFKYDVDGNLKLNSCEKIVNKKNKQYKLFLRDDLYYYNGKKVSINDFYNTILKIINNKCYAKFLFENVKKIELVNNYILIILKHRDLFFLEKLSYYSISPYMNFLTCGPYYIYKKTNENIILKRNEFYRNKINNFKFDILDFKLCNDIYNDLIKFEKNEINMTNNTTFPLNKINFYNPNIFDSNLFMCIKFNTLFLDKKYKKIRKIIFNSINSFEIKKELKNIHISKSNFCLYEDNYIFKKKKIIKLKKKMNLRMGYTDYYPNKQIAEIIKKQLKRYNIELELLTYDLCSLNRYDFYLDIEFSPFNFNEYLYLSKYFRLISGKKYKLICNLYEMTKNKYLFILLKKFVEKDAKIIPLIKFKYIYLCDNDLKKFNHILFNYEEL